MELKTLVRGLWLSGVYDHLNAPNLCFPEEVARRACQLSSCNIVPVPMRSFAFRRAKVETENLSLCATKTTPVFFEDGEWECLSAPHLFIASLKSKGKGKEKTGPRQLAAAAAVV